MQNNSKPHRIETRLLLNQLSFSYHNRIKSGAVSISKESLFGRCTGPFLSQWPYAKKAAKNKSCKLPYKLAYSQECGHEHNTHTHISNQSVTLTKFLHEQERLERTAPSRLTGEYSDYSWGHHSHQYVQLVNNVPILSWLQCGTYLVVLQQAVECVTKQELRAKKGRSKITIFEPSSMLLGV